MSNHCRTAVSEHDAQRKEYFLSVWIPVTSKAARFVEKKSISAWNLGKIIAKKKRPRQPRQRRF